MCAGALTAITAGAGEIALGATDVVLAGGVEHMGHHPMGDEVDFNPRFVSERLVDTSAVTMGATAENLHDAFPHLTKQDADAFAVASQRKAGAAWQNGMAAHTVVPMSVFSEHGLDRRRPGRVPAPGHDLEGLAGLRTPFRAGGRGHGRTRRGSPTALRCACSPPRRRPRSSGSSRRFASSASPTRESSRS